MIYVSEYHFIQGVAVYGVEEMSKHFAIAVDPLLCDHDLELKVVSYGQLGSGIRTWNTYGHCRKCPYERRGPEFPEASYDRRSAS